MTPPIESTQGYRRRRLQHFAMWSQSTLTTWGWTSGKCKCGHIDKYGIIALWPTLHHLPKHATPSTLATADVSSFPLSCGTGWT